MDCLIAQEEQARLGGNQNFHLLGDLQALASFKTFLSDEKSDLDQKFALKLFWKMWIKRITLLEDLSVGCRYPAI